MKFSLESDGNKRRSQSADWTNAINCTNIRMAPGIDPISLIKFRLSLLFGSTTAQRNNDLTACCLLPPPPPYLPIREYPFFLVVVAVVMMDFHAGTLSKQTDLTGAIIEELATSRSNSCI